MDKHSRLVMESGFGEKVESINALSNLVLVAPKISSATASILLAESYETTYGIHNHTPTGDPLESVLMHPLEDTSHNSRLYEHIRSYIRKDVFKHSGLSLNEFFELPRDICDVISTECDKKAKAEGQISADVMRDMEKLKGGK